VAHEKTLLAQANSSTQVTVVEAPLALLLLQALAARQL